MGKLNLKGIRVCAAKSLKLHCRGELCSLVRLKDFKDYVVGDAVISYEI